MLGTSLVGKFHVNLTIIKKIKVMMLNLNNITSPRLMGVGLRLLK